MPPCLHQKRQQSNRLLPFCLFFKINPDVPDAAVHRDALVATLFNRILFVQQSHIFAAKTDLSHSAVDVAVKLVFFGSLHGQADFTHAAAQLDFSAEAAADLNRSDPAVYLQLFADLHILRFTPAISSISLLLIF